VKSATIAMGVVVGLGVAGGFVWSRSDGVRSHATTIVSTAPLRCEFHANETAAFTFTSTATIEGQPSEDHFAGVLRWFVASEAEGDGPAVLRAALGSVALKQELSEEKANASDLTDSPFYVRVDSTCRFRGLGFSPQWSVANRHLVEGLFESSEFILPDDASSVRWAAEQQDGVGAYTGQYRASASDGARRIVRTKPSYHADSGARQMGIRVQLLGARADARFDPTHPGGFEEISGREHVRIHLPGEGPQGFVHTYRLKRDDARYVAVSDVLALGDADFAGATAAEAHVASAHDPAFAAVDHDAARARFNGFLRESGKQGIYPASRYLAEWLRAHPEESGRLLEDLRSGAIDKAAHSALFLALELAGTNPSRQVLADAVVDRHLAEVDRARAAAALADHGEPTAATAELLTQRARSSGSPMVASASLLGLGRMAARTSSGDPLKLKLRSALEGELARAKTDDAATVVVDAVGNSGDAAFAPALDERLRSGRPSLRTHVAEALGHMPADIARPRLTKQLEVEESPGVSAALVRSLTQLPGNLTDADLALATKKLAASSSDDERAAIIDWLGHARDQEGARQALVARFSAETSASLKQRIGTFVPPADLRTARR
jgi:hypothetical protein